MNVFLDTNILFSAMIWPNSKPALAFNKAVSEPHVGIVCTYSVNELRRIIEKKVPQYLFYIEKFLYSSAFSLIFVPVPLEPCEEELKIRDIKDRPLLRAAIKFGADYFLTGDKDFLESGIQNLKIITASEFLEIE
ncbi:MAG: putative toxin-antitoxin system toxin component, PIN family [Synergistaceae bacterium]|nr:putative toxin-antitoxin system toxin component, PIN family [Synergistaceae bacterium]